jgi:hypothetical protein
MNFSFTPILSWFSSLFSRVFTDHGLLFTAKKVIYYTFLTITLPIVIKNLITWLFYTVSAAATDVVDVNSFSSVLIGLSGVSAWLAQKLMLKDCISIILSAVIIRFKLNFIPFVK